MTYKLGIDVGGTFTDLFLWSPHGKVETFKVLSTPEDPSVGVIHGLGVIAEAHGMEAQAFAAQVSTIVHGTTVTTNAVLTRRGARTALLTTEGVRDALEMRRGIREERYNNRYENVVPLVPRRLRLPIPGRLDHAGVELEPLSEQAVLRAAKVIEAAGVDAIAVCFMNSFANPAHEEAAAEIVTKALPSSFLCTSAAVLPSIRFYNRVSTTVLNAYVGPVLRAYLDNLTAKLANVGFRGVLLIMQSNGGVALPEVTRRLPATTLLSGPAAGPGAAAVVANEQGYRDCILVDMGGTSFDASLVSGGAAAMTSEGEIDRLKISLPMLAITTIGAGGGSIGWLDEGGLLRMGPQSAGALPGPACYGRGGELPACTDADLVLGYLDPSSFAGSKLPLDVERARRAIRERVATPLNLSIDEAAAGMYRVINANMAHGVREITVKRGLDPREFPLVVAGGAGALHACMIALELEMPVVLVPATASVLCAAGMLMSDLQHDFVRSYVSPLRAMDEARVAAMVSEMVGEGTAQLRAEGVSDREDIRHEVALDLRYLKQYHEVTLSVPRDAVERGDFERIRAAFHQEHNRLYGYDLSDQPTDLELINVRVRSIGTTGKPRLPRVARGNGDATHAKKGARRAFCPESGTFQEVPVYDGHGLLAGDAFAGPALIDRVDTTIFVSERFQAELDELGTCVLRAKGEVGHG